MTAPGTDMRRALFRTGIAFFVAMAVMAAVGLVRPWVSPDTASFLAACRDGGCWGGSRTPFYGWMLQGAGPALIVALQFGAVLLGAYTLCFGVAAAGGSTAAATAAGLAVTCSTVTLLWTRALLPEAFAHAALIAGLGLTLQRRPVPAGLLIAAGCLLKPALLPFLVVVPAISAVLNGCRGLLRLTVATWLPIVVLVFWRWRAVGDANIVSFGGFQMSGIAALMLTPDLAAHLPAALRPEALDIVFRRDLLVTAGLALPIPMDSAGLRSFFAASLGYSDILARTYDPVLYGAVRPGRLAGESWVAFNARMQHLSLATFAASPGAYLAWVVGGLVRVAGRIALFNPTLTVPLAACALLRRDDPGLPRDRLILWTLLGGWLIGTVPPIVMLSFPAQRYIDSAGMMLPLLALYRLAAGRRKR